jgi:hypothetical protein
MFGTKRATAASMAEQAQETADAFVEESRRVGDKLAEREAELKAQLESIEAPPDLFRIVKDHTKGTFTVEKWSKQISGMVQYLPFGGPIDLRSVSSGHDPLCSGLPTHKAAEAWLAAYLDPTTNRTCYDAEGRRIEVAP